MSCLKEKICLIAEKIDDYLLSISNKGVLTRAKKELLETKISLSFEDDNNLIATFPDGTIVKISKEIKEYSCSCPSRSICKHVLMAIIFAVSNNKNIDLKSETDKKISEKNKEEEFSLLLSVKPEMLIKNFGKKIYRDVLNRVNSNAGVEINKGKMLSITLKESLTTIIFLPGESYNKGVCSCKANLGSCTHILEAILQYIKWSNEKNFSKYFIQEEEKSASFPDDYSLSNLPLINEYIKEIFKIGLSRISAEYGEKSDIYATLSHGDKLTKLEKLFSAAKTELLLYTRKNSEFNKNHLISVLTRAYKITKLAEKASSNEYEIILGSFKKKYLSIPKITLYGIGAYTWYSKSGFAGITALFFAPDYSADGQVFSFSNSRPCEIDEYSQIHNMLWKYSGIFKINTGIFGICRNNITLTNAKISNDYRISSSEETCGNVSGVTELNSERISKIVVSNYLKLPKMFDKEFNQFYVILKTKKILDGYFDKINQTYYTKATDYFDNYVVFSLKYSKLNENGILNLEYMEKNKIFPDAFTVSVSSGFYGEIEIIPLSYFYQNTIESISRKKLFNINFEKKYFQKFFE